jgi:hypothetical protein
MGSRVEIDAVGFTGCFVHVFSFELDSVFSMPYSKVLANNCCAHRARDGAIMSGFALDVEGDAVGSFRLNLEVCCSRGLAWHAGVICAGGNTGLDMVEVLGQELLSC